MRISVTAKKKSPTTANHLRRRKALGWERKRQLLQKVLLLKAWPIRSHDHFSFTHLMEYWNYNIVLFLVLLSSTLALFLWDFPGLFTYYYLCGSFFFIYLRGCLGHLVCITTNLTVHWTFCKPSEYVKHRGVTDVQIKIRTRVQRKWTSLFRR